MAIPKILSTIVQSTQDKFVDSFRQRRNTLNVKVTNTLSPYTLPESSGLTVLNVLFISGLNYADITGAFEERTSGAKVLEGLGKKIVESTLVGLAKKTTSASLTGLTGEDVEIADKYDTASNVFKIFISPAVSLISKDLNAKTYFEDVSVKAWEQYDENRLALFKSLFHTLVNIIDPIDIESLYPDSVQDIQDEGMKDDEKKKHDLALLVFKIFHVVILAVGEFQKLQKLSQSTLKDKLVVYVINTAVDLSEEHFTSLVVNVAGDWLVNSLTSGKGANMKAKAEIRAFENTVIGIALSSAISASLYQIKKPLLSSLIEVS